MNRRKGIVAAAVLAVLAGGGVIIGGAAAHGSTNARTASQLLTPAVTDGESTFYTDEQIDKVWREVVKNFSAPLPEGYSFPESAPAFFHPADEESHLFQSGLPDLVAARYFRCYWLDFSDEATRAGNSKAEISATSALDTYSALPSVSRLVDVEQYESQMESIAAAMSVDVISAELEVECGGIIK